MTGNNQLDPRRGLAFRLSALRSKQRSTLTYPGEATWPPARHGTLIIAPESAYANATSMAASSATPMASIPLGSGTRSRPA
jgi:hypothetical protein